MFFSKKKKSNVKCEVCSSKINDNYSFCPYCGSNLIDEEKEMKNFGMLGRNDISQSELEKDQFSQQGFGFTDKLINSLMSSLMKNLDKQFKEMEKNPPEIKTFPNGIRIKIGPPQAQVQNKKVQAKTITQEQMDRMSSLPRSSAKTNVRRLSNKVVYELSVPGILSPHDVFVSKTESGYEVKAIGSKKVYVNSLPIDLPIKGFSVSDNKLFVEFRTDNSDF